MSDTESTMNVVMFVIQMYSTSVEVFLHRHLGERYLGMQAVGVIVLIPLHSYFLRGCDLTLLTWFIPIYLMMCAIQRSIIVVLRSRGYVEHSRYNGYPWLLGKNPRIDELFYKHWIEPLLVFVGGVLLSVADPALGSYFATAGIALFLKGRMMDQLNSTRLLDMRDAMFEQQHRAEQFREVNGDLMSSLRGQCNRSPWRR